MENKLLQVSSEIPADVRGSLKLREALLWRMPYQTHRLWSQFIIRGIAATFRHNILSFNGLSNIGVDQDPFILALNHTQKLEAPFVPATLAMLRGGKMIRFIADWNLMLVPGVWVVYRAGEVIVLDRKPAKPPFLNIFRPLLTDKITASERAAQLIDEGHSIGIFPEGTTNNDSKNLLRGFYGAAQLSITKGVPVVPAGIRFPYHHGDGPIREMEPMEIEFGASMQPPETNEKPKRRVVMNFHHAIMQEISRLSGKSWQPESDRKKHVRRKKSQS